MFTEIKHVRVLEHEKGDHIRIGMTFPTKDLEKAADEVLRQYDKKLEWCGGMEAAAAKYYERICLVDAASLSVLKVVWSTRL